MQDSSKLFKDPVNPTKEELKIWAFGNYYAPMEDFQLFVVDDPYFVLNMVIDTDCPTGDFFLESLYVWLGDTVRNHSSDNEKLEKFLEVAEKSSDEKISKLVERAKELINDPKSYDYSKWGIGGDYTK